MANSDYRAGLIPKRNLANSGINMQLVTCYVASTYATDLFIGDPIVFTSTANTARIGNHKPGTLQEIEKATAGATNIISGVIVGFDKPNDGSDDLSKTYNPASTQAIVRVCLATRNQVFEIQADSGAEVAATDIGANADVIFTHDGDTTSGLSGVELDTSAMSADATFQLTILGLVDKEENALGTNAKLEVLVNLDQYNLGKAGI